MVSLPDDGVSTSPTPSFLSEETVEAKYTTNFIED